jgi:hypothetical protein
MRIAALFGKKNLPATGIESICTFSMELLTHQFSEMAICVTIAMYVRIVLLI